MFKSHNLFVTKLLADKPAGTDWKLVLAHHVKMLSDIQHERLIHLLVTIFVGLAMTMCSLTTIVTRDPLLLVLDFPLIVLFTAYIFHYWFLENTTQSWYTVRDSIEKLIG